MKIVITKTPKLMLKKKTPLNRSSKAVPNDHHTVRLVLDSLRQEIRTGFYPTGTLPSKAELAQRFGVPPPVIEDALQNLVNEGVLKESAGPSAHAKDGVLSAVPVLKAPSPSMPVSIAETLQREIAGNQYPGGALPSVQHLALRFSVDIDVIKSTLAVLEDRGVIRRLRAPHTIHGATQSPPLLLDQVAVLIPGHSHLLESFRQQIVRELILKIQMPILFDPFQWADDPDVKEPNQLIMDRLLRSPIRGALVDGSDYIHLPQLNGHSQLRSVIINCFNAPGDIPDNAVLTQSENGMYRAVDYLVSKGHQRIVLVTARTHEFPIRDPLHRQRNPFYQYEGGYRRAMKKNGLEACQEVIPFCTPLDLEPQGLERLQETLQRPQRPTAYVCVSDDYAVPLIRLALNMNLSLPQDLAVIGLGNTPLCLESPVSLTSISLEENLIAREAVDLLLSDEQPRHQVRWIEPVLVVRESTY